MKTHELVCPVSFKLVDSHVNRITAFLSVMTLIAAFTLNNPYLLVFLTGDYLIRAFVDSTYSPLRTVGYGISRLLGLKKKPVDSGQKIFAARLGFLCSAAALVLVLTGYPIAGLGIAGMLGGLAMLDAAFDFCVGCLIYNYMVYPFYKKRVD